MGNEISIQLSLQSAQASARLSDFVRKAEVDLRHLQSQSWSVRDIMTQNEALAQKTPAMLARLNGGFGAFGAGSAGVGVAGLARSLHGSSYGVMELTRATVNLASGNYERGIIELGRAFIFSGNGAMGLLTTVAKFAAPLAALTPIVLAGSEAWKAYGAHLREVASAGELANQTSNVQGRLMELLSENAKRLNPGEAKALHDESWDAIRAGASDAELRAINAKIQARLKEVLLTDQQKKQERELGEMSRTWMMDRLDGYDAEIAKADEAYRKAQAEIEQRASFAKTEQDFAEVQEAYTNARLLHEKQIADIEKKQADEKERQLSAEQKLAFETAFAHDEEDARQAEQQRRLEMSRIGSDWRLTDAQKYNQLSALSSPEDRKMLGPDPSSFADQWKAASVAIQNAWGTMAQQVSGGAFSLLNQGVHGLANSLTAVIMGTKRAGDAFKEFGISMLTSFVEMITQIALESLVVIPILTALGVLSGGATAQAGSVATIAALTASQSAISGFIGAREFGGPVSAGRAYVVGERRPELFVPSTNGYIHPSVGGGGGGQQHIAVNFFPDESSAYKQMESSPEFRHMLFRLMNGNAHQVAPRA